MSESVGRIDLDMGLDYKKFNNDLNNISSTATNKVGGAFKKLGGIIAGAFAVTGITMFGRSAINLASDLSEVQNVVDVTFGSMSRDVDNFAKQALESFGLSELSAKSYTSTMGAMLKSSGLTGLQMTEMSKSLTGLSADMASFYNLNNSVAFDKIRAGISGETEPLKQLGINMSVANLEAFALSKGITKSFNAMSQGEQILLRYNYLMSTTADAQGDFARTSDEWANQTRILSEQFKSFQGIMGQGFINVLAPVVKWLNTIILKLQIAAKYFEALTRVLMGFSKPAGTASVVVGSLSDGLGDASAGLSDVASDAKKAGKAIKGSLSPFDELNVIGQTAAESLGDMSSALGSGAGAGMPITEIPDITMPDIDTDAITLKVQAMVDSVKSMLSTMFDGDYGSKIKNAFSGLGPAMQPILEMKKPIQDVFMSIGESARLLLNDVIRPLGGYLLTDFVPSIVTSFTSSFAPVFSNIVVSALQEFDRVLRNSATMMSDLVTSTWIPGVNSIKQAFIVAFPQIAQSINSLLDNTIKPFVRFFLNDFVLPIAKSINEVFVPIFSEITVWAIGEFVKVFQWAADMINDIYATLIKPVFDLIKLVVLDTLAIVQALWAEHGRIILEKLTTFFKKIRDLFQQLWDVILKPIIKPFLEMVTSLWNEHLKGLVEEIGHFIAKLIAGALEILNEFIIPLVSYLIDLLGPTFHNVFALITDIVQTIVIVISDVAKAVFRILGGIIDFLVGVFTGDWKLAWNGVKDIIGGIFDAIVGIVKGAINLIIDGVNFMVRSLNKVTFSIPDWVPVLGGKSFGFSIPEIPKLAKGGLVSAPTLAMVGDNKNANVDPEVITPLSKLQDMLGASNQAVVEVLLMILDAIENQELALDIDGERLSRIVKKYSDMESNRVGKRLVTVGGMPI